MIEAQPKRLVIAFVLIFILGVLFAVVNGWYTNATNEQLPLIVYGISLLSLVIGAVVVILFQWKINRLQINKLVKILPSNERIIVKLLLENNYRLEQNRIVALSSMTKVQVSRTVHKLIERDVIEKKDLGNTNLLILKM